MGDTYGVCERDFLRVSGVPQVLTGFDLLDGGLTSKRGDDAGHCVSATWERVWVVEMWLGG